MPLADGFFRRWALMGTPSILIAGAGPVGVVAALAAAQAGFCVHLVEAADAVNRNPRAATTHPSTLEMINRIGLLDRFIAEGLVAEVFQFWDRATHELIATFDHGLLADETPFPFVVQTEQHKLAIMGIEALRERGVNVRFSTAVVDFTQDSDGVTVRLQSDNDTDEMRVDWLIGADGGRSTVRKHLGVEFEGYTWPERFLVLTVRDDLKALMGCCYRNYITDPEEWINLFKVSGDDGKGLWRAVFPTKSEEEEDAAFADPAVQTRLSRVHALGHRYDVVHRNLYRVHQRVAANFRVGRVLLAGDAAHVNNPIGGLGLNFGIHDAIDAIDSLKAVVLGGADAAELDRYARRRRMLNVEFVQEQTVANKKRMEEKDPAARRAALERLRATAEDPKLAKQFLLRTSLINSVKKAATIE
jgi:3-(3-hydroxy-phenyl)propionate hydroxylase